MEGAAIMKFAQPIKEIKQLNNMKRYLADQSPRDALLFAIGIASSLRVSDILKLKVGDFFIHPKKLRQLIELNEQKTGKYKAFPITANLEKALFDYAKQYDVTNPDLFLFRSKRSTSENKAISRMQVNNILAHAADQCGIEGRISSHSMRKTFAYHAYRNGVSLDTLCIILNHRNTNETKLYLSIQQEDLTDIYKTLNL